MIVTGQNMSIHKPCVKKNKVASTIYPNMNKKTRKKPSNVFVRFDMRQVTTHKNINMRMLANGVVRRINFLMRKLLKRLACTPTPGYSESNGEGCASGVAVAVTPIKQTLPFNVFKSIIGSLPVKLGNFFDT